MRRFEFPVDKLHAKSVNETLADLRRLQWSAAVMAVALGAGAAGLFVLGQPWSYILGAVLAVCAVTSLWMVVWTPRKVGSIDELYAKGNLVPAVVSEIHPRGYTLLSLLDIAKPDATEPHYALATRTVRALPGRGWTVGKKIPSVSVLGDRSSRGNGDTWQMVSFMPIAWGTRDSKVLTQATARIDDVEWNLLRKNISMSEKVRGSSNQFVLVDPAELPNELRG
ncbi:DUF3239 domain-containing protein [Rhodococcus sp. TAF43]|uniref:DUF3239 domain-containing protein n=1 Tax=unclassified Rhodococcus (in: high G+C Gram-positive bacteria) TaxID=192944 RepID=UPI000E0A467B|nr:MULTISPECIES: DUF3239 domain-containing protein [unclassified Rhodococcus (in: high G+C Gram-positive bacteria)]QKT10288.1 DUF3239 domain-containing protein [Rhodococcus sp. W8901]RDI20471.1 uncharacterized protein DUF3239 [Rhodococcus sp. AG1013]